MPQPQPSARPEVASCGDLGLRTFRISAHYRNSTQMLIQAARQYTRKFGHSTNAICECLCNLTHTSFIAISLWLDFLKRSDAASVPSKVLGLSHVPLATWTFGFATKATSKMELVRSVRLLQKGYKESFPLKDLRNRYL